MHATTSKSTRGKSKEKQSKRLFKIWQEDIVKSNPKRVITMIREGAGADVMDSASTYFGIPKYDFAQVLGMSPATAQRKSRAHAILGHAESERLARIAIVEAEIEAVFGNEDAAKQWLLQKNLALGDTPLSMLDTETGAQEVKKILSAIAYGGAV